MLKKKENLMIILGVLILLLLNFSIYEKENILKNGENVFFELGPVDPRSLMQGDYMTLRYRIMQDLNLSEDRDYDYLVFNIDENGIASNARPYKQQTLGPDEKLIKISKTYFPTINPNSFFFQEGYAHYYNSARYGVFKYHGKKDYVLSSLADEEQNIIMPPIDG